MWSPGVWPRTIELPIGGMRARAERAIGGRASVLRQYLAAGLVDEFERHVVPILLGAGDRPLEGLDNIQLEPVRVLEAPGVAHLRSRVTM